MYTMADIKQKQKTGPKTVYKGPKVRRTVNITEEADSLVTASTDRSDLSRSEAVERCIRTTLGKG